MLVRCPEVLAVMPPASGPSSISAMRLPSRARWYAVLSPAMPPPTMHASACTFRSSGPQAGISAVADQRDWRRAGMSAPPLQKTLLLGRLVAQGDELLRHRGVDADGRVEL